MYVKDIFEYLKKITRNINSNKEYVKDIFEYLSKILIEKIDLNTRKSFCVNARGIPPAV